MSLLLFLVVLFGCCGYALWRGGGPERWAAGLQLGAFAIDDVVHRLIDGSSYATVEIGSFTLDVALLLALIVLAHRSTRYWPLWLGGWQIAAIVAHITKTLDPGMAAAGYAFQAAFWAYPMLFATAWGAVRHQRRVKAGIYRPAWRSMVEASNDPIRNGARGPAGAG